MQCEQRPMGAAEKPSLWQLWKAGQSVSEIARGAQRQVARAPEARVYFPEKETSRTRALSTMASISLVGTRKPLTTIANTSGSSAKVIA